MVTTESLEKFLNKEYYNNLLLYLNKNNNHDYDNILNDYIEENNITNDIIESENNTITESINTMSDDYVYKKSWNKLNIIHKKIKIKEFINNLNINKKDKNLLISKFILLVNNKKITKKNDINYDKNNGIITSIPLLKHKNNKYYIEI
jgi:hypothetical protein